MVTQGSSRKLDPKKDWVFRLHIGRNHTVTVDVKATYNFVSIYDTTLSKTSGESRPVKEVKCHDAIPSGADNAQDKYVGERTVRHEDDIEETKYLIRLYGYSPAEDTFEPPHYIPQHFIRRYLKYQWHTKQRSSHMSAQN